jgi:antitoxin ParD1/3/4
MTLNVSLTPHLEAFVEQSVRSGRFRSASELIRSALRLLEHEEQKREATLAWLRGEVRKGLDSGPPTPLADTFWDDLRSRLEARGPDPSDA